MGNENPPQLPDSFEEAERFQRLFVKPMVDAVRVEVKSQLEPVVSFITTQQAKDQKQDERLTNLEGSQRKALVGWGVFATFLSIMLTAGWNKIKSLLGVG